MKKVISLILCLIIFATLPIVAHAQIADYIIPDTSTIIAGVTGKDVPIHGTLPNYDAGTAFTIIVPGLYQDILVDKENVETHDLVKTEDKDEDTTPIIKEEIDEEVKLTEGTLVEQIFALTNKERKNKDLKELKYNKNLQAAADIRAKECAENFSHTRPDGTSCHTVVADMDYQVTGENLVKADTPIATAETLMDAWMTSEGHRANILLPEFTSMAVGVYEKNNTTYVVQIFLGVNNETYCNLSEE